MIYLDTERTLRLYERVMQATGGSVGLRDRALLESALAGPRMTFGGEDLYPSLEEKAAALGYSLIKNHPFVDGNKRVALAATDAFLRLNGFCLAGEPEEVEAVFLDLASGVMGREAFTGWLRDHVRPRNRPSE